MAQGVKASFVEPMLLCGRANYQVTVLGSRNQSSTVIVPSRSRRARVGPDALRSRHMRFISLSPDLVVSETSKIAPILCTFNLHLRRLDPNRAGLVRARTRRARRSCLGSTGLELGKRPAEPAGLYRLSALIYIDGKNSLRRRAICALGSQIFNRLTS